MIDDKILRQDALDTVTKVCKWLLDGLPTHTEEEGEVFDNLGAADAILMCNKYISKALEEIEYHCDEHCTNCKEYDREHHSCPRFNDVISSTIRELRQSMVPLDWFISLNDYDIHPESVEHEGETVKWGIRIKRKGDV